MREGEKGLGSWTDSLQQHQGEEKKKAVMIKDRGMVVFRHGIQNICADIYQALGCVYDIDVNIEGQEQKMLMDVISAFQKV